VEEAEEAEEPRVLFFVPFFLLLFPLGAAGGAVVGACCRRDCCCRFAFLAVVGPSMDVRWGVLLDDGAAGGGSACAAGVSERAARSSATVSAVGEADEAAAALGTSTKSPVEDRGEWRGGEVEKWVDEERDQTISSSSEGESLAHLVLEVSERMSREVEREVVMGRVWKGVCGDWEKWKRVIYLIIGTRP
jgi:hypothetical protein